MILCVSQLIQMFSSLGDEALLTGFFCNGKNLLLREQILSFKNDCISLVLSTCILYSELALFCDNSLTGETEPSVEFFLLYARLKNGHIMLYPSASVRPSVCPSVRLSVRPSVNFFVSV